ncbi:universal stress protein [Psychroserpens algicola]|uniref:Universal stress protein n=1 Tax=Psychroserpens algicola TaxID=1719034 RepID=A0ABT0H8S9_9FLAO|nr:universal stress protein [Psychroserpens algicola]MCK8480247.1 universal stress protein [Psychroserpens algicola]
MTNNNKYKILVLSDLKEGTSTALKNTISLSKMVDADIELFHVIKPIDVVETDSQLSAMRTISKKHIKVEKKIRKLIDPISEDYGSIIHSSFTIGNVKNEIEDKIKKTKPDIIVLGKRKPKKLSFIGDSITEFVLNTHKDIVMIASGTQSLEPEKELSLGFFNNEKQSFESNLIETLISQTDQSLKSFNIVDKLNQTPNELPSTTNKKVDFVFEKNDNVYQTLSSYLVKNKVNLLCVGRIDQAKTQKVNTVKLQDVIDKVDVSLLLTS